MKAEGLTVTLGRRPVLHGLDFEARPGELITIIGPNGSGKSTLLRALAGEHRAAGRIWLNGRLLADMRPAEQAAQRAVLPQSTSVAFPFTAMEIVRLGLSASARPDLEVPQQALARVGLGGMEHRPWYALSGGEQQRVHLARALAQVWTPVSGERPNWLLLDEPVSSLDIGHQFLVMDLVQDYAARGGGVIAVMHDLNLAAMYSDQVLLMKNGRIAAYGKPAEAITSGTLSQAYGCTLRIGTAPRAGTPFLLPQACR